MKRHPGEQQAFEDIRQNLKADKFIKNRIMDGLHAEGLIRKEKTNMKRITIYWVAATVAALIIGFILGQNFMTSSEDNRTKYALFLYENEDFNVEDGNTLVAEYSSWAGDLAQKGLLVSAEKLADQSRWMGQTSIENLNSKVTGYFIYRADSYDEAMEIANSHPHTGYGGGVELREIEKLD